MAKILVAEDEKVVQDLFGSVVESMGHTAIKSPNGKLAWEILCANPDIAFLVCDIAMPVMDGRELIRLIRQHTEFSSLPIAIVSSVIRAKDIAHLLEEGATHFLPKPVALNELREVIGRYVTRTA